MRRTDTQVLKRSMMHQFLRGSLDLGEYLRGRYSGIRSPAQTVDFTERIGPYRSQLKILWGAQDDFVNFSASMPYDVARPFYVPDERREEMSLALAEINNELRVCAFQLRSSAGIPKLTLYAHAVLNKRGRYSSSISSQVIDITLQACREALETYSGRLQQIAGWKAATLEEIVADLLRAHALEDVVYSLDKLNPIHREAVRLVSHELFIKHVIPVKHLPMKTDSCSEPCHCFDLEAIAGIDVGGELTWRLNGKMRGAEEADEKYFHDVAESLGVRIDDPLLRNMVFRGWAANTALSRFETCWKFLAFFNTWRDSYSLGLIDQCLRERRWLEELRALGFPPCLDHWLKTCWERYADDGPLSSGESSFPFSASLSARPPKIERDRFVKSVAELVAHLSEKGDEPSVDGSVVRVGVDAGEHSCQLEIRWEPEPNLVLFEALTPLEVPEDRGAAVATEIQWLNQDLRINGFRLRRVEGRWRVVFYAHAILSHDGSLSHQPIDITLMTCRGAIARGCPWLKELCDWRPQSKEEIMSALSCVGDPRNNVAALDSAVPFHRDAVLGVLDILMKTYVIPAKNCPPPREPRQYFDLPYTANLDPIGAVARRWRVYLYGTYSVDDETLRKAIETSGEECHDPEILNQMALSWRANAAMHKVRELLSFLRTGESPKPPFPVELVEQRAKEQRWLEEMRAVGLPASVDAVLRRAEDSYREAAAENAAR